MAPRRESMELDSLLPNTTSYGATIRGTSTAATRSNISKFAKRLTSPLLVLVAWIIFLAALVFHSTKQLPITAEFHIHTTKATDGPITGRLMVCIAKKEAANSTQPRFLINDSIFSQQIFGTDVNEMDNNQVWRLNASNSVGFPQFSLNDIPEGEYWVQAVLNSYTLYNRSDNSSVWLPAFHTFESNNGVLTSPGTLFSQPKLITFSQASRVQLILDQITPPEEPLADTKYLKHVKFKSNLLSDYWGVDVFLKAWVLLPFGFDQHPEVHYPLFIYHSHYSKDFEFDFFTHQPNASSSVDDMYGYYLYRNWTGTEFQGKRGLIVQLQHANPYYDDSYAVNSKNIGPYGDAITYEFIPHIEKLYRGIGQGWARTLYGGSTGGWESFAVQVFYPDQYNGCWSFCPDALDFKNFQLVNVLKDENAYYTKGTWTENAVGSKRDYLGRIIETMEEENHHELAMGSHGRSGGQWDAWQAVYGPQNPSGYPDLIWDKATGDINHTISNYWREHFDIHVKLKREWPMIGPKLINKLHLYVGVMDSYYLNGAAYHMENFLNSAKPYYNGSVQYGVADGRGYEHCWSGSYDETLSLAWNTLNQRTIPLMIEHLIRTAPEGADLSFTTY